MKRSVETSCMIRFFGKNHSASGPAGAFVTGSSGGGQGSGISGRMLYQYFGISSTGRSTLSGPKTVTHIIHQIIGLNRR